MSTTIISSLVLLSINLGLLWLLMAAPVGTRTIRISRTLNAAPDKIWNAVYPKGGSADWHHATLSSNAVPSHPNRVRQSLDHLDRTGKPIVRTFEIERASEDAGGPYEFDARIVEDSALDVSFWKNYRERRQVSASAGGARLVVEQTDHYRGIAFMLFRYFALRREIKALEGWIETGQSKSNGIFEHPAVQVALAILSTLMLWPFFGLNRNGLLLSSLLTVVIVLHELGHMAAYRAFGHKTVRMIFVPLLGGIAIGGRPYNTLFEIATCALMGAGMSAFLVPVTIALHDAVSGNDMHFALAQPLLVFLLILGAFNLLNLLPMSRFDGGQVLRQIFRSRMTLVAGSFGITLVILWVGWRIGLPATALAAGLAVFILMSLIGFGSVKPRHAFEEMSPGERLMAGFGLFAAVSIHSYAIIYACDRLFS